MGGDQAQAASVLSTLLSLDAAASSAATAHFATQMSGDPSFMMKAMSMRTAVESKNTDDVTLLLIDCFALTADQAAMSATSLLAQYD